MSLTGYTYTEKGYYNNNNSLYNDRVYYTMSNYELDISKIEWSIMRRQRLSRAFLKRPLSLKVSSLLEEVANIGISVQFN
jgi:hypothetical protein